MKISRKILALFLAFALAAGMTPMTLAADSTYSDVPANHWARGVIAKWSGGGYGVLEGDGSGRFLPENEITLAELAALLSKTFGYTERVPAEVTPGWADEYVEKAVAAGIIGKVAEIDATAVVTREQAVKYIAIAYSVAPVSGETGFADNSAIGAEYKPYVNAFQKLGYVAGKPGNVFDPAASYTRAEAMQLIENTTSEITDKSVSGQTYSKSLIIRKSGVTVKDATINGSLIIGQGVGDGDVHLENVTVKGNTIVNGGGKNSIYAADFRVEGSMIVRKYEGESKVRIVVSGESNFSAVVLYTGAILVTQQLADGSKINVEIPADFLAGSDFEFIGNFDNVVNNGKNANLTVTGSVNKLTLNEPAKVGGSGKIVTAEISAGAGKDTSFKTAPVSITGSGKSDVKLPGSSSTGGVGGDIIGGNTGGGGGNTAINVTSVTPITAAADHNAVYTPPAEVSAALSSGAPKDFAVAWTPDTADTSACGTFEYEGTLTMTAGYANPNNIKARLTLTVSPVLSSVAVTRLPAKTMYNTGEELDLTGLIVTGTYSDGSTRGVDVTVSDVAGYEPETAGVQTLTVAVEGKTITFDVTVYATADSGNLVSITVPAAINAANGAAKTAAALNLPPRVEIVLEDSSTALADVAWDIESASYDPETKTEQIFTVDGTITLPEGIENTDDVPLTVQISVTVSAAKYTVRFDLNGQPGATIQNQTVEHGANATEPPAPASASHNFAGWKQDRDGVGEAWDFGADTVESDLTLYAIWQIKTYTVSFNKGNAIGDPELPQSLTVDHGSVAAQPADPVLAGYAFGGWYIDEELETPYNWSSPVTSSFTIYAKFADTLTLAADALTFDIIKGANTSEQGITANLALLTSMLAYPGVTISWVSSDDSVIVADGIGTVTRPEDADAEVTLTATLTLNDASKTKTFNLLVRMSGIADVIVEGADERFAPGYPVVSFANDGSATLKIKLKQGVASVEHPVVAYLVFDSSTSDYYTFDKESILYGHAVSKTANQEGKYYVWTPTSVGELIISGDGEFTYTTPQAYWNNSFDNYKIGIVLLADDDLADPLATATVISLSAEEVGYVDVTPPSWMYPYLSEEGDTLYVHFDEKLSTAVGNTPSASDFVLIGYGASEVTVTDVTIDNSDQTGGLLLGRVTLALSGNITNEENLTLQYTPGTNKLADANTNEVTSSISAQIIVTQPAATAYVNPTAGTVLVQFTPGLHYWLTSSGNSSAQLQAAVSLKYGGEAVGGFTYSTGWWSTTYTSVFFTFTPMPTAEYNETDFTLYIATGLKYFNMQTIVVNNQEADQLLPQITAEGITAAYDAQNSRIVVTLPSDIWLYQSNSIVARNFALTIGENRPLYRTAVQIQRSDSSVGTLNYGNVLYMPLTARLKEAIEAGGAITVSYAEDTIYRRDPYMHLADITGAYLPAFGPVTVSVASGN